MPLKILFEIDKDREKEIKKWMMRSKEVAYEKGYLMEGLGVPTYQALNPYRCEKCGDTYWSSGSMGHYHQGCGGYSTPLGFSA